MTPVAPDPPSLRIVQASMLTVAAASAVQIGLWLGGATPFVALHRPYLPSAPVTLGLLAAFSLTVWLLSRRPTLLRAKVAAGVVSSCVAVVGAAVVTRQWVPVIPDFELALTPGRPVVEGVTVALVSPYSGAALMASAGAVLLPLAAGFRPVPRILAAHLGIGVGLTALVSTAAHIVGGPPVSVSATRPMALPTALIFLVLTVGLVAWAQPDLFAKVRPTPRPASGGVGIRSIRRAVAALITLGLAGVMVSGLVFLRHDIADLGAQQRRSLEGIVSLKVAEVSHWRQERLTDGDWLFSAPEASALVSRLSGPAMPPALRDEARSWLAPLVTGGEYDSAAIYDRDRRLLFSYPDTPGTDCAVLMRELSGGSAPGRPILTDLHPEPGRPDSVGLGLIVPVGGGAARDAAAAGPAGFVVLHADAERRFFPSLLAWPGRSDTGEIALVRRDGDAALVLNRLRHLPGPGFRLRVPLESADKPAVAVLKGEEAALDGVDYRGVPVVAVASAIRDSGWVLLAKVDRREVYALVRERAWMVSVSLVLMTVGVALGLSLVHRRRDAVLFERELAERRRRQDAEQNFQMLFRQMLDAVALHEIICDKGGTPANYRFLAANPAFETITGLKAEQIIGRTVLDVLPDVEAWWIDTYGQVALGGTPMHFEHYSKELGRQFAVTVFSPAYGQFVTLFHDVTERQQTQSLLIQAEKMRSVAGLAAGVAHEINNPLGVIAQAADNIERRALGDLPANHAAAREAGVELAGVTRYLAQREVPAFLADIRQATARATRIVSNMLEFSRRNDSEMVSADLSRLLDRAFELAMTDLDLRRRCDLRAIPVVRDYAVDLPPVSAVAVEIEQVLLNLIVNAAQAMAELPADVPARLELRTFAEEGWAAAEVIDNGPGMTADVRRRVFEPFFTTKPPGRGTGLGLAVAFAIVTQHHQGRIDVESQPGSGTRVAVRLPLRSDGVARNTEDPHG